MIIPAVDLRASFLDVRDQGRRQSCLAFASSTAHEHHANPGEYLSVEYLFYHAVARTPGANPYAGTTMQAAAAALAEEGQPVEMAWPYNPVQLDSATWIPPRITAALNKIGMAVGALAFDEMIAVLDVGRPIILGIVITDAFYHPDGLGRIPDRDHDIERGGHAVLAVGYGADANRNRYLLIRNSWGDIWGLSGHAWLSRGYVDRQLHETALLN